MTSTNFNNESINLDLSKAIQVQIERKNVNKIELINPNTKNFDVVWKNSGLNKYKYFLFYSLFVNYDDEIDTDEHNLKTLPYWYFFPIQETPYTEIPTQCYDCYLYDKQENYTSLKLNNNLHTLGIQSGNQVSIFAINSTKNYITLEIPLNPNNITTETSNDFIHQHIKIYQSAGGNPMDATDYKIYKPKNYEMPYNIVEKTFSYNNEEKKQKFIQISLEEPIHTGQSTNNLIIAILPNFTIKLHKTNIIDCKYEYYELNYLHINSSSSSLMKINPETKEKSFPTNNLFEEIIQEMPGSNPSLETINKHDLGRIIIPRDLNNDQNVEIKVILNYYNNESYTITKMETVSKGTSPAKIHLTPYGRYGILNTDKNLNLYDLKGIEIIVTKL